MGTERSRVGAVEAGIDWLTWVTPRASSTGREVQWCKQLIEEQRERGSKVKPFVALGYHGEQAEGCAYGLREDTTYLRISGSLAALRWCEVLGFSGMPSRLDVQTTLLLTSPVTTFGARVMARTRTAARAIRGRPPTRTLVTSSRGSWTGSVGTRANPIYLRVYDKGIESGSHARGLRWRIELEAKAQTARKLWEEARIVPDRDKWYLDVCERAVLHCAGRWPLERNATVERLPVAEARDPADVERKLAWLKDQVAPSIASLLPYIGTERLLQVLGLDGYALALTKLEDVNGGVQCGAT